MTCTDCLKNCGNTLTTDKCVKYTGPDVPVLGICNGDSLFQIEQILINQLTAVANGSGITLSDITLDCAFITNLLGSLPKTVENLVQVLMTASCQTKEELDALSAQVNAPFSISGECLTLPSNPTRDQVLQAIAVKLCSVSTTVDTIAVDYVKASQLCSLVTACISGGGPVQEFTKMPKYVAMPYHGPLSVFDASGKGLSSAGYDKVYLCVGQTVGVFTLPDYRGRSPIGSNTNVPGGPLDAAVDPALPQNAGYSITPGIKKGEYAHTLTNNEGPVHTHSVNDSGHTHTYNTFNTNNGGSLANGFATNHTSNYITPQTATSLTGISLDAAGGGQPHNTTHPTIGCSFIMYVP